MCLYMGVSERMGLVTVDVSETESGKHLVVSGHNPAYPPCKRENPGRFCGDIEQPRYSERDRLNVFGKRNR